jgi:hypothetical protein
MVNEQITLGELGLTDVMCVEIKKVFELIYNLPFTSVEIQQLTIKKIKTIEFCQHPTRIYPSTVFPTTCYPSSYYPKTEYPTTFYPSTFSTSTCYPTTCYPTTCYPLTEYPTVFPKVFNYTMPTRVVERLNSIEMTPYQVPLVVVHPIEGHCAMLKQWAKNIHVPVFCVQFTPEAMQYETIEQLSEFYWTQIMREICTPTMTTVPQIHLCGFSFGAQIAYEMATKRNNSVVSLTFLDGSHCHFNNLVTMLKQRYNVEKIHEIESEILFTFLQQHLPTIMRPEVMPVLMGMPTMEQRVCWIVRELLTKCPTTFNKVELDLIVRSFVTKMMMAIKYQPTQTLKYLKEINLIKSMTCQPTMFGQDFGLNQVFGGKLNVHVMDCEQRCMFESTYGMRLATIMNEFLPRCF